ncbi:unnamed protein product, partial [marine sediment metagenome]
MIIKKFADLIKKKMREKKIMKSFNVDYRNYGHWDIYQNQGRIFTIRGGP